MKMEKSRWTCCTWNGAKQWNEYPIWQTTCSAKSPSRKDSPTDSDIEFILLHVHVWSLFPLSEVQQVHNKRITFARYHTYQELNRKLTVICKQWDMRGPKSLDEELQNLHQKLLGKVPWKLNWKSNEIESESSTPKVHTVETDKYGALSKRISQVQCCFTYEAKNSRHFKVLTITSTLKNIFLKDLRLAKVGYYLSDGGEHVALQPCE